MSEQTIHDPQTTQDSQRAFLKDAYRWATFVASHWSPENAEDVVQESLTRALERWDSLANEPAPARRKWVKQVALRTLIDLKRREGTADKYCDRASVMSAPEQLPVPHEVLSQSRARGNRERVMSMLTAKELRVYAVWARQHCRDISVEEAAALLGMDTRAYLAARSRLARTLRKHASRLHLDLNDFIGDCAPAHGLPTGEGSENDDEE